MKRFIHFPLIFAVVMCPLLVSFQTQIGSSLSRTSVEAPYELTPSFFKFISAGYWPAAADLFWIDSLQHTASDDLSESHKQELFKTYRLLIGLDPKFYEVYDQGAIAFTLFFEDAEAALWIINQGIAAYESGNYVQSFWTHPYTLYLYRAYVYAFLQNDWGKARTEYLTIADMPRVPVYFQNMKVWLNEPGAEKNLAKRVLNVLIKHTTEKTIRERYQKKLDEISNT